MEDSGAIVAENNWENLILKSHKNFYMKFAKRFKNLILCSNLHSNLFDRIGGVEQNSKLLYALWIKQLKNIIEG